MCVLRHLKALSLLDFGEENLADTDFKLGNLVLALGHVIPPQLLLTSGRAGWCPHDMGPCLSSAGMTWVLYRIGTLVHGVRVTDSRLRLEIDVVIDLSALMGAFYARGFFQGRYFSSVVCVNVSQLKIVSQKAVQLSGVFLRRQYSLVACFSEDNTA